MSFAINRRPLASAAFALLLASSTLLPASAQETTPAPAGNAAPADDAAPAGEAPPAGGATTPAPATAQAAAPAPAADTVVATINGTEVTEGDLAMAMAALEQQFSRLPPEQKRAAALSSVIEIKTMAAKAAAAGLDQQEDFKRRMEFLRERALHANFVENEVAKLVTDEAVRARYDKDMAERKPVNEVKARHIIVKTKEEAQEIIKQLDAGGDFEALAKEKSTDGAAAQGGDLGYFGPGQMVPEFETAAFALDVGSYSKEPVQTQFGWHVVKVDDKRAQQPPAFEQVKDQYRQMFFAEKYLELVKSVRGDAKIEITDPQLKAQVEQMEKAE